ncbi:MAG: chlorophyll a/b-binding protein [Elainellaceae cyanobacterium]
MENQEPKFGFTEFAETWNGRLAMIGFVLAIIGELVTGQGLLAQMGIL